MLKKMLVLFLSAVALFASAQRPALYDQLGGPIYAFADQSCFLRSDESLGSAMRDFCQASEAAARWGTLAEASEDSERKAAYLQQLRQLEKTRDAVTFQIKKALIASMDAGDVSRFETLMRSEPLILMKNEAFRKQCLRFYHRHGKPKSIVFLETVKASDRPPSAARMQPETNDAAHKSYKAWMASIAGTEGMAPSAYKSKPSHPKPASKSMSTRHAAQKYSRSYYQGNGPRKGVVIVTTKTCPACKKAKRFFREERIAYREYDLYSSRGTKLYKQHGGYAVPLIIVGKKVMTGLDRNWFATSYK